MNAFAKKVVIVTGATGGIGRAAALAFAREGVRVVVSGRLENEGHETVALIRVPPEAAAQRLREAPTACPTRFELTPNGTTGRSWAENTPGQPGEFPRATDFF